jgi:hypothetical protein
MEWSLFMGMIATGAPPAGLADWIWSVGWLAALALLGLKIWEILAGKKKMPQPFLTEKMEPLATKRELRKVEEDLSGEIGKLSGQIERDRVSSVAGMIRLHERVDRIAEGVGEVGGQIKVMARNVEMLVEAKFGGRRRKEGDDE